MPIDTSIITYGVYALLGIVILAIVFKLLGIRVISSDEVGIVEKWWSMKGSLKPGEIIALNGEAGYQPEVLRGGIHLKSPIMYRVIRRKLITIPQGKMAYIFARGGQPLKNGQILGKEIESSSFQDVRAFLANGGQKGPQRAILREGTYAINLAQFVVIAEKQVYSLVASKGEAEEIESMRNRIQNLDGFNPVIISGSSDMMATVVVNDGPSLPNGVLIAPIVGDDANDLDTYHNNFQDPEKFLAAGGKKGRQMQTLTDGTYFINRLFATVELCPKTVVGIGETGVVVSYFGEKGSDISGDSYTHGELVENGYKGIWKESLPPGKYAFNKYAGEIRPVPTNNVILKWISGQSGNHKLDENLKEINLITKDAFEPSLPLTVVFNIDYKKASSVIQRFGSVKMLIEQSIDPMVAGYFKNIGQTRSLIELIIERNSIQEIASAEMREKFAKYDLELAEVLIGTPASSTNDKRIDNILEQLRDRQVAREQVSTFEAQQKAAEQEKTLNEARAKAKAQEQLTQSAINIEINENLGKAELMKANQEAAKIQKLAEADNFKTKQMADATAYQTRQNADAGAYKIEREADASNKRVVFEAEAENKKVILEAEASNQKVKLDTDAKSYENESLGKSEAEKIRLVGEAEADRIEKVGMANGIATKEQIAAYGDVSAYVAKEVINKFSEAIKEAKIDLVPKTVITSGNKDGQVVPNALEILTTLLVNDKLLYLNEAATMKEKTEA